MRLTLRTLLAYLDDTLEPAQTKLIGQKVAESPAAQALVARIKEVVRRRRLTVPPDAGPDARLDVNTIAEYIDNTLPSEQLGEVEEICLESDIYLAEIAACHQVLTLILSEPILVPPTATRRMVGLVKGEAGAPTASAKHRPIANAVANTVPRETEEGLATVPVSGYQRFLPLAAVALLSIGLTVAILYGLGAFSHENQPPVKVAQGTSQMAGLIKDERKTETPPAPTRPAPSPETRPAALSTKPAGPDTKPAPLDTTPPTPMDPKTEAHPDGKPEVEPPPQGDPIQVGNYQAPQDGPSILLRRLEDKKGASRPGDKPPASTGKKPILTPVPLWQRLRDKDPVTTDTTLVSLPGYRSPIHLNNAADLLLWGTLPDPPSPVELESSVVLYNNPKYDIDLHLIQGRITLANHKTDGPIRARVRFHREAWDVTLDDPGSEVFLELWGQPEEGVASKESTAEPIAGAFFIVLKGQAHLKVGYESLLYKAAPGPAEFDWNNVTEGRRVNLDKAPDLNLSFTLPPELVQALAALAERLDKGKADVVLPDTLEEEKNKFLRQMGVFCLGATDNLPRLLDALEDEKFPDVRFSTTYTLRHWLARGAGQDAKLYAALQNKFGDRSAEILLQLLHGYSRDQFNSPDTWGALISYLTNDRLAIRELANSNLVSKVPYLVAKLPKDLQNYDLAGGGDVQDKVFKAWKNLIPDNKLPPPPAAPTAPAAPPSSEKKPA